MKRTALALAMLVILAGTSYGEVTPTKVTKGDAPTIDGALGEEEWEGALRVDLEPTGEAFLRRDDEALYVGLRVGRNSIPSLALLQGEKILILHASASLGTAEYEQSGETWKATRTFSWQCRDGQTSPEDGRKFLADEGWFGTTCGVGRRGEAEFRIERRLLTGKNPRVAVVACRLEPRPFGACAWPETVRDGATDQALLMGNTPTLRFDPSTWARLDCGNETAPAPCLADALDRIKAAAKDDPVGAYVELLDLLDAADADDKARGRAKQLRRTLEAKKPVSKEAAAQKRLESALKLLERKLREIEDRYPDTRAARIAAVQREALAP